MLAKQAHLSSVYSLALQVINNPHIAPFFSRSIFLTRCFHGRHMTISLFSFFFSVLPWKDVLSNLSFFGLCFVLLGARNQRPTLGQHISNKRERQLEQIKAPPLSKPHKITNLLYISICNWYIKAIYSLQVRPEQNSSSWGCAFFP